MQRRENGPAARPIISSPARIVAISNATTAHRAQFVGRGSAERRTDDRDGANRAGRRLRAVSFAGLLPKLPGNRVLAGNFQQTGIAVAVPKGRPAALKLASGLIEDAKKSGLVRRALDAAGFKDAEVAPLSLPTSP